MVWLVKFYSQFCFLVWRLHLSRIRAVKPPVARLARAASACCTSRRKRFAFPNQKTPLRLRHESDDIIKVDSALVPIPVSVLNFTGQAVTNLRLEDFELLIDGKKAEISDIARSETGVRLALLFDNSSSVTIAREFEKKAAIQFFRRVIRPEKDLVALYSVSTISRLEQNLTKDVSSLVQAIENFTLPKAQPRFSTNYQGCGIFGRSAGRRVIVIVSDGDDTVSDRVWSQP